MQRRGSDRHRNRDRPASAAEFSPGTSADGGSFMSGNSYSGSSAWDSSQHGGSGTLNGGAGRATSSFASDSQFSSVNDDDFPTSTSMVSGVSRSRMGSSSPSSMSGSGQESVLIEIASASWLRRHTYFIVSHGFFSSAILFVIVLNTALLAIQTTPTLNANYGWYLSMLDQIFLGIYLMETGLKLYVFRLAFFKSGWNNFDITIVFTSVISFALPYVLGATINFNPKVIRLFRVFRAFRAVRSLRALRAISFLRSLQVLVQTLLQSIPAMSSIVSLAALVLYIFAVIARSMYGTIDVARFGTLGTTFFRLFAVLTLDDWTTIYYDNSARAPDLFIFLFLFVVLEAFVLLNLFVAVIVSNLEQLQIAASGTKRRRAGGQSQLRPTTGGVATVYDPTAPNGGTATRSGGTPAPDTSTDRLANSGGAGPGGAGTSPDMQQLHDLFRNEWGIDNYYSPNMPARTKALTAHYFMLAAALEHNVEYYQTQQKVLDDLVDLVKSKDVAHS
ncbi:Cation channel sperm-associated protein 1 [Blastocladiella emersonii ATCC 22665]|nr:Cation channel sperm-associated protein 1 [Blastocladiella emersonii ATCC 22665]